MTRIVALIEEDAGVRIAPGKDPELRCGASGPASRRSILKSAKWPC